MLAHLYKLSSHSKQSYFSEFPSYRPNLSKISLRVHHTLNTEHRRRNFLCVQQDLRLSDFVYDGRFKIKCSNISIIKNCDSLVGVAMGFDSLQCKILPYSAAFRPALGPHPVSFLMDTGGCSSGDNAAGA